MTMMALFIAFLSSCTSSVTISFYSFSYPSYTSPAFDFNPIFGTKRKLSEYEITRSFGLVESTLFEGPVLNPQNYAEDETGDPYYREDESSIVAEPIDYSEEEIIFEGQNNILHDFLETRQGGSLSEVEITELFDILDQNDEIINHQEVVSSETILYHGFLDGQQYSYNNYHKIEQRELTRFDNDIIDGSGSGIVYFQDGFEHEYTLTEQIQATGFKVYEIRDETFPSGSTSAFDYKISSMRQPGMFKQALTMGGGGRAKRFITDTLEIYAPYLDYESDDFSEYYSYDITSEKTEEKTTVTFTLQIDQHLEAETKMVYEMDLIYEIIIEDGIVTTIHAHQVTWANL